MKFFGILKHIGITAGGIIILLVVPFICTGYPGRLLSGSPDVISSASVVLDAPSGDYVVMINKDLHTNEDNLKDWISFFKGEDITYIFEDVAASVADIDTGGIALAESYRSKLPENQMRVREDDATILLSRADNGLFDIIVMSKEFSENYKAEYGLYDNTEIIRISTTVSEDVNEEESEGGGA